MRSFDSLSEKEILALAISLEEEDNRTYGDLAEAMRESYPGTARMFAVMAEEENGHRHRLLELVVRLRKPAVIEISPVGDPARGRARIAHSASEVAEIAQTEVRRADFRLDASVGRGSAGQPFDGLDLLRPDHAHRGTTGARRAALDQDRAGAAAALAAAVLAAGQAQVVAQHAQQRAVGVGLDGLPGPVDVQFLEDRHEHTPGGNGSAVGKRAGRRAGPLYPAAVGVGGK